MTVTFLCEASMIRFLTFNDPFALTVPCWYNGDGNWMGIVSIQDELCFKGDSPDREK